MPRARHRIRREQGRVSKQKKKQIAPILLLAILCGVVLSSCSQEASKPVFGQTTYEFLANEKRGMIKSSSRPFVTFGQEAIEKGQRALEVPGQTFVSFGRELTIKGDTRRTLFQHPFSEVRFNNVQIPPDALLHFGIGIDPAVWEKPGDGVSFRVTVINENSTRPEITIFTEYMDPKRTPDDRKWRDYDVDLNAFADQKVSFIFATDGGPRNDIRFDWAAWSDPKVGVLSKK